MSLRWQLLALSLLTLVLPWAGCQYAREMESVLRDGFAQAVLESATTMARALDGHQALRPRAFVEPADSTLYAPALIEEPRLDGYLDDWSSSGVHVQPFGQGHRFRLGIRGRTLYAYIELHDPERIHASAPHRPPYGDRLALKVGDGARARWLLLQTAAPGQLRAVETAPPDFVPGVVYEDRVVAAWTDTAQGYAIEVRLPLALAGERIGFAFVDVDGDGADLRASLEPTWTPLDGPAARLRHPAPDLHETALQFRQSDRRLRIVDREGWLLFDGGPTPPPLTAAAPDSLAGRLYRWLLDEDSPPYGAREEPPGRLDGAVSGSWDHGTASVGWYRTGGESAVVVAAVPVRFGGQPAGALLLEQSSAAILSLTDNAAARLVGATALASFIAALALLGYATLLSLRVRHLARGAERALGSRGDIDPRLPGQAAGDEIGDLARSFGDLLRRVQSYNDYLRTLSSKLAHELRTPLAVASTSLDNIEREQRDGHLGTYVARLREGMARLDKLIRAMSEATALEQAVESTRATRFDLSEVVAGCVEGYRRVHAARRFELGIDFSVDVQGAPELVQQMLDKLIDNAVQFSSEGSTIVVTLEHDERQAVLRVTNAGPRLPAHLSAQQLFDSMVSARSGAARGHLGLGLYIAALVARYHGAAIDIRDREDGSGVVVSVVFPRPDVGAAVRQGKPGAARPR